MFIALSRFLPNKTKLFLWAWFAGRIDSVKIGVEHIFKSVNKEVIPSLSTLLNSPVCFKSPKANILILLILAYCANACHFLVSSFVASSIIKIPFFNLLS